MLLLYLRLYGDCIFHERIKVILCHTAKDIVHGIKKLHIALSY